MNNLYKPFLTPIAAILAVVVVLRLIHELVAPIGWLLVVLAVLAIVGRLVWARTRY